MYLETIEAARKITILIRNSYGGGVVVKISDQEPKLTVAMVATGSTDFLINSSAFTLIDDALVYAYVGNAKTFNWRDSNGSSHISTFDHHQAFVYSNF